MPSRTGGSGATLLARQRRAAERLRREVMGGDGSLDHPYFRRFDRFARDYESRATFGDVVAAAALADIVYVADFHAVAGCQRQAARLLEAVARRTARVALGVEFVYTSQQRCLDLRQAGQLDDEAFLRRIRYGSEWGYPWDGFRELLDRSRALGIEVHALDAPPRGGFSTLARRDAHAARRIAALLGGRPDTRLVVLIGETHLAPAHLPRAVKSRLKRAGLERSEVVVLQNPDRLYWKALAREGDAPPEALRVNERTFALLHTGPLEKYEAYRTMLSGWESNAGADDDADLTSAVNDLIHELARWIGVRPERRRLRHRAGWTGDLADAFPEVYSGARARDLLEPILAEHGHGRAALAEARARLRGLGALYDARSNALFVERYRPGPTAGECARFLRAALTGRLFVADETATADAAAAVYCEAFEEALAHLGRRLVEPVGRRLSGPRPRASGGLALARSFEASRRRRLPEALAARLRSSRGLRRTVGRDVGHRLGERLYEQVRAGELTQAELRRLFARPLAPEQAVVTTMRLLRGGARRGRTVD